MRQRGQFPADCLGRHFAVVDVLDDMGSREIRNLHIPKPSDEFLYPAFLGGYRLLLWSDFCLVLLKQLADRARSMLASAKLVLFLLRPFFTLGFCAKGLGSRLPLDADSDLPAGAPFSICRHARMVHHDVLLLFLSGTPVGQKVLTYCYLLWIIALLRGRSPIRIRPGAPIYSMSYLCSSPLSSLGHVPKYVFDLPRRVITDNFLSGTNLGHKKGHSL